MPLNTGSAGEWTESNNVTRFLGCDINGFTCAPQKTKTLAMLVTVLN